MGIFFKDGFWKDKPKKSEEVKPSSKFDYSNAEVEACGLNIVIASYKEKLDNGNYYKYVHTVKLKNDIGEYKAGSKFTKTFGSVMFKHSFNDAGGVKWEVETFVIDLRTWKRV